MRGKLGYKKVCARIKRMIIKLKVVKNDKSKKNIFRMIWELMVITIRRRCLPTHYFSSLIYRKGVNNYLDYISNKEAKKIHKSMHCPASYQLLDNKLYLQNHFSRFGIPMPKKIAFNYKQLWFIEEKTRLIREKVELAEQFVALLRSLFAFSDSDEIFAKPIVSFGGKGAFIIGKKLISEVDSESIKIIFESINNRCYIIQEKVNQHPEMSRFNPSSVNTIRVATFSTSGSHAEVISAFLRLGRAGNIVDNIMSGGLFIGIDLDSGKLNDYGCGELEYYGGVCRNHPDSGVDFRDFKVPYFPEVKRLALQAASLISSKLVGWDIAITSNGPILIEANHWIHLGVLDAAYGGLRKNPIFKKVMLEAGITN